MYLVSRNPLKRFNFMIRKALFTWHNSIIKLRISYVAFEKVHKGRESCDKCTKVHIPCVFSHLRIEFGQNWNTTEYVQNPVSRAELVHSKQRIGPQLNCNNLCNKMVQWFTKDKRIIFVRNNNFRLHAITDNAIGTMNLFCMETLALSPT